MAHYLDVFGHLDKVADHVKLPDVFFSDDELKASRNSESLLIQYFRRAKPTQQELLVNLAREIG